MDGSQFQGGPPAARGTSANRDDAISADPHLLDAWKQAEQDWYEQPGNADKAAKGSTEGWDTADKALDDMISRRKDAMDKAKQDHMAEMAKSRTGSKKGSRAQRRYPTAVNDNEADE